jgi:hypothetical protein
LDETFTHLAAVFLASHSPATMPRRERVVCLCSKCSQKTYYDRTLKRHLPGWLVHPNTRRDHEESDLGLVDVEDTEVDDDIDPAVRPTSLITLYTYLIMSNVGSG